MMEPCDAIGLLMLAVPLLVVFAHFGVPAFTWRGVWILTPTLSWLIVNYDLVLRPPHNGMAYEVHFLLGWVWLLPVVGLLWLIQACVFYLWPRLRESLAFRRFAKKCAQGLIAFSVILLIYGTFGWISGERAVAIAIEFLARQGGAPTEVPHATKSPSGWTVMFGDASGQFVHISNSGTLLDGGSPSLQTSKGMSDTR